MALFRKYIFYLDEHFSYLLLPSTKGKQKWDEIKSDLVKESGLSMDLFKRDFECFKLGIRLKAMRYSSKVDFSSRNKISIYKINQIEQNGFNARLGDIYIYTHRGLNKKWEPIIK